jgi:long-chain acyl-CoA synthetase
MTQVTRLFDFPYYQQDKYTSIPDALNTKQWCLDKNVTQEYIEQANALKSIIANGNQKNDKIAVISSNNRTGNIMDIGVLQTGAKRAYLPMTDDYEYILNHSRAIFVLYLMQKYFKK